MMMGHTEAVNKRHGLLTWRVAVNALNVCHGQPTRGCWSAW